MYAITFDLLTEDLVNINKDQLNQMWQSQVIVKLPPL